MKQRLLMMTLFVSILAIAFTGCAHKRRTACDTQFTSAARHKATMRPYEVLGKCYSPTYVEVGQVQSGVSSWYGPNFHGKHTSNGEVYNMHGRTAAHKTWPMDTMVKVKNLQNGTSTVVRINDRGPFARGRIIDCSYAAGKELGLDRMGIAQVSIKVVGFAGKTQSEASIEQNRKTHTETRVVLSNFGVQVGAFRLYDGAKTYQRKYRQTAGGYKPIIKRFDDVDGAPLYRVWLMGFASEDEARDFADNNNMPGAFIITN